MSDCGIFKNVLLCSDIDGTLTSTKGEISPRNAAAVAGFIAEGGLFTVATGRFPGFISEISDSVLPNTGIIALNGCVIADPLTLEETVSFSMSFPAAEEYERLLSECPDIARIYLNLRSGYQEIRADRAEDYSSFSLAPGDTLYKLVFVSDKPVSERTRRYITDLASGRFICEQSWDCGIELYSLFAGKGNAVRTLKKMTGSEILVCVGDYENDASMLSAADIGIAVANAHPAAKAAADFVLPVTCDESALEAAIQTVRQVITDG